MGVTPITIYDYDPHDLGEWLIAMMEKESDLFEVTMNQIAWQTSLLMNATGNYKKEIKPSDLYSTPKESDEQIPLTNEEKEQNKKQLQEELLNSFGM